jgi:hypothetical protein
MCQLKRAVLEALDGLRAQYGEDSVREIADGQGGAWVEILRQRLCDTYAQPDTTVICLLPFNLPNADVYPTFVRADLSRVDGAPLGEGFQDAQVTLPGEGGPRSVVQVSRRTREGFFAQQTAAQKVEKVLSWIRSR